MKDEDAFVVTIDGPGGSGKGSLALNVAHELGFHLLDSGAIYRLLALKALQQGADLDDEKQVAGLIDEIKPAADILMDMVTGAADVLSRKLPESVKARV